MRDLGVALVRVIRGRAGAPVSVVLTDEGRALAARAIPLLIELGTIERAAELLMVRPRQLQILISLHALSGDREDAEIKIEPPKEGQ